MCTRDARRGGSLYETLLSRADDGAPKLERRSYDFRGRSAEKGVKRKKPSSGVKVSSDSAATKRRVSLSFDGADPQSFIGLKCKVYWPLDADWYSGRVVDYDSETNQHQSKSEPGYLILQRTHFFVPPQMQETKIFIVGSEEAKIGMYLSEQQLPERRLRLQNGINIDGDDNASGDDESGDDCARDFIVQGMLEASPHDMGDLQVISLGKIVKDSKYFSENGSFGLKDSLLRGNLLQ